MCMLHVHACIKNNIRKKIQGTVRPPSVLRPPLFRVVLSALSSSPFPTRVWSPPAPAPSWALCVFYDKAHLRKK